MVAALLIAATAIRLRALLASPYPTGIDGYWYLIQVRSLLEDGRLYYPSAPLVPWLMAGAALVLGPPLAVKVIAALGSAALVVPSYLVARRVSGSAGPALLGAALVATSAQSFFLSTEFVKQAVGLSLAVGFVAALAALLDRPGWRRGIPAVGLLLACGLAHKTALALAVLLTAPPIVATAPRGRRRLAVMAGLAAMAVATLWLGGGFALLRGLFRATPDFSFAVLATPGRAPLVLGHEVGLAAALALAAVGLALSRRPADGPRLPPLALGFAAFGVFLGMPWLDIGDDQGLAYRLRLCACVALAPASAMVAARLVERWRPARRTGALALVTGLVLLLRPWASEEGVVKAHPAMVLATSRLAGALPAGATVVVPERHTAFMTAFHTRAQVRLRPATTAGGPSFRMLPGAAIRPGLWAALDHLRAHPTPGVAPSLDLHALHPNGLVVLSEPTFQYLLARLPAEERRWYEAWPVR